MRQWRVDLETFELVLEVASVKGEDVDAWYFGKAHRHGGNSSTSTSPEIQ
jgi:hypothetical protein